MLGRYTYTLSTLTPGEEITLVGRLHYFALIIPFCLTALTFTVLFFAIAFTLQLKGGQMLARIQIVTMWLGFFALRIIASSFQTLMT